VPLSVNTHVHDLADWLDQDYATAYRTACLLLRDPADAEEAVQEAFLRAWRFRDALPQGDGRRPWLYRVLVNVCWSQLRKEVPRRSRSAGPEPLDRLVADVPAPDAAAVASERARAVGEALADLPEHLRAPVVLRFWAGLTEREIAVAIKRRPGTVKSRLHEARRRLAEDPRLGSLAADAAGEGA
jgi:RNA polymerase sigma-70 factor (ECF subfamily)